ncbi:MAG: hypothetical protein LZ171_06235 [Thaumarchaeota archaeon]|jgi:hypothetical protein|nr:hypothetical protein [Candidatus Geocrenenecus arthurdayi]
MFLINIDNLRWCIGMREKIIKFVRDVLEGRGVVQEMRIFEFDLDEVL